MKPSNTPRIWRPVKQSISNRVLLVVMATTLIALLTYGTVTLIYDLRSYHSSVINDLATQARIIAEVSTPALEFADPATARENLELLRTRPGILRAALFTPDNQRFAEYISNQNQLIFWPERVENSAHYRIADNRIEVWQPIIRNGQLLGTVYIRGVYEATARLISTFVILGGVLAASLGLALLVAIWLRRALVRPIIGVAAVAREVMNSRDFSLRAEKLSDDEIGLLADAFNDMLSEVQRRSQALEESNRSLEREMAERSAAEEALRVADRRKDEFLATLAHELRNPLAPLMNGLQMLRLSKNDPGAQKAARHVMDRQLKQMVRLVDDLLDVSRITTGKLNISPSRVAARAVMRDAIDTSRSLVEARGHSLSVQMPPPAVAINADPLRLAQVFSNLLNNAAKYTPEHGHIEFTAAVVGRQIVFTIKDDGIGISRDKMGEIFDMFTQVDQSLERTQAGLGVGLALAKHLVELHGGDLRVSSDGAGCGTTFSVWLQVAEQMGSMFDENTQIQPAQPQHRRMLLVDDNVDFATTMGSLLTASGHEVRIAHDGAAALAIAENFAPEFAFLDIGMPGMNGYDLARRLRQLPALTDCVLVAITGWGQEKDRELSRRAGFRHHLVKPVKLDAILSLVAEQSLKRRGGVSAL